MSKMGLEIRQMVRGDAEQLHKLHASFTQGYVGPLERDVKYYKRAARKKDGLRWVAINLKGQIVGYIMAFYLKRRRFGRIFEIAVDPNLDFSSVARILAEKVHNIFVEKGAATIQAPTMLNPNYEQVFPEMGFFKVEMQEVFMVAINNIPRFLDEIRPVMVSRLRKVQGWNGTLELKCGEHSAFLKKDCDKIQTFDWTNCNIDCRIIMDEYTLVAVLLGVIECESALSEGKIQVKTTLSKDKAKNILEILFPKRQFLAFNFW
jgi:N-acetylglutamate synthase-like GNAT family acetyltransferase